MQRLIVSAFGALAIAAATPQHIPFFESKQPLTLMLPAILLQDVSTPDTYFRAGDKAIGLSLVFRNGTLEPSNENWRTAGFPALMPVKYEGVSEKRGSGVISVRYSIAPKAKDLPAIWITCPSEQYDEHIEKALSAFIVVGAPESTAANTYLENSYRSIASAMFSGALFGQVSTDKKIQLLKVAHIHAVGLGVQMVRYKDRQFLQVDLKDDVVEYNDARLSENQQIARALNDRLLVVLKQFAAPLEDISGLAGIALHGSWSHHNFVTALLGPAQIQPPPIRDDLLVYAPADAIKKFARADITNQDLVDASEVLVKGNRIRVDMTGR